MAADSRLGICRSGLGSPEVEEDGDTFEANARKKAVEAGQDARAMDSGRRQRPGRSRAGGEPGVYSARYAGKQGDNEANNDKLLQALGLDDRISARRLLRVYRSPRRPDRNSSRRRRGALPWRHRARREESEVLATIRSSSSRSTTGRSAEPSATVKDALSHRARALEHACVPIFVSWARPSESADCRELAVNIFHFQAALGRFFHLARDNGRTIHLPPGTPIRRLAFPGKGDGKTMPAANSLVEDIKAFRHYQQAERGMASNTVLAYGRDLERFCAWAAAGALNDPLRPSVVELGRYLADLHEGGLAPRSIARHLIGFKMFYRFLRWKSAWKPGRWSCWAPALWERIPQVLSPENVEKLLAAPQGGGTLLSSRPRVLETLYATGSRVSEVVQLRTEDLHLDSGFCKCVGKGSKQRIVPLGKPAQNALRAYLDIARPELMRGSSTAPWVFLSRGGAFSLARCSGCW